MSGNVQAGLLMVLAGVALFEAWRRGYLDGVVAAVKAAAAGTAGPASLYVAPRRAFRVVGGTDSLDLSAVTA